MQFCKKKKELKHTHTHTRNYLNIIVLKLSLYLTYRVVAYILYYLNKIEQAVCFSIMKEDVLLIMLLSKKAKVSIFWAHITGV